MNTIVIILGIVLIILVYVLYKYFTVSSSTLVASGDLKLSIPQITDIQSPKNVSYAYGTWIFVNAWDNVNKPIFTRDRNIKLYLDSGSPTLRCDIYMNNPVVGSDASVLGSCVKSGIVQSACTSPGTYSSSGTCLNAGVSTTTAQSACSSPGVWTAATPASGTCATQSVAQSECVGGTWTSTTAASGDNSHWKSVTITDNFPLQKWTFILVSVDGQFVDCYLDGKLVVSNRLYLKIGSTNTFNYPAVPPDTTGSTAQVGSTGSAITLGNASGGFDAYIAKFNRWTSALDPQSVWNAYMEGNGQTTSNPISGYGVNLSILKNNIQQSTYSLL